MWKIIECEYCIYWKPLPEKRQFHLGVCSNVAAETYKQETCRDYACNLCKKASDVNTDGK